MAFRQVFITQPAQLHIKHNQLVICQKKTEVKMSLEDIDTIVLESHLSILTSSVLSACAKFDIALFTCNEKHLPHGISLPFQSHKRQRLRLASQINLKKPFKKRIWQQIIQQKITNQALVLKLSKAKDYQQVMKLVCYVDSGDSRNVEATAARAYFKQLFYPKFTRQINNCINASLNYGYAILRGLIARTLTSYGFIPSLGIYHHNEYNNFNLADDFIEPFRPIIDLYVQQNIVESDEFTTQKKAALISLLSMEILLNKQVVSISNAMNITIKSFVTAIKHNNYTKLLLPQILPLKLHKYE